MNAKNLVFWDVDTQIDFVEPDGNLYVKKGETLKPVWKQLNKYAKDNGIRIMGSIDAHTKVDPEMKENGGPFPYHCMLGTLGQLHISETRPEYPVFVQNRKYDEKVIPKFIAHKGEIYFEKQDYDVLLS